MPRKKHIKHCSVDVFLTLTMMNNCKHCSGSFPDVLGMHIVSGVSSVALDIGGSLQGSKRRTKGFQSAFVCGPHRMNRGQHRMFEQLSASSFSSVLPPLPLHRKKHFLFHNFWQKNITILISSHWIVSYGFSLNESISFMYHNIYILTP